MSITNNIDLSDELTAQARAQGDERQSAGDDDTELTPDEREQFLRLEAIVEEHLDGFIIVGNALRAIRDERLYRENYSSFEQYLAERWEGISRSHAYRLIDAALVNASLSPIGDKPLNEAQARELVPLLDRPEEMRAALAEASADGPPTAAKLNAAVAPRKTTATRSTTRRNRRSAIRVRDLPDVDAILKEPVFSELDLVLGTIPTIKVYKRMKALKESTLDDIVAARNEEHERAVALREQAKHHQAAAKTLAEIEKRLRPLFTASTKAAKTATRSKAGKATSSHSASDVSADATDPA